MRRWAEDFERVRRQQRIGYGSHARVGAASTWLLLWHTSDVCHDIVKIRGPTDRKNNRVRRAV
jgi:hypothetical protein